MASFSTKIKELLKKNNLTEYRLSAQTGIPSSTISRIINGASTVSVENAYKIASFFGVSIESLFINDTSSIPKFELTIPSTRIITDLPLPEQTKYIDALIETAFSYIENIEYVYSLFGEQNREKLLAFGGNYDSVIIILKSGIRFLIKEREIDYKDISALSPLRADLPSFKSYRSETCDTFIVCAYKCLGRIQDPSYRDMIPLWDYMEDVSSLTKAEREIMLENLLKSKQDI